MSNPQEDDQKPIDQEQEAHVILKVKSQDGDEVFFKIKKSSQLRKLMYVYCDRRGLQLDAFAFIFDGARIHGWETPDELDMEDGDKIDAMRPMSGGLRANQLQWSYMDDNEVFFRIKRSTQLKKLMNAYCHRQCEDINSIVFFFDGRRLRAGQTVDELDMEDGDVIYACHSQGGGLQADHGLRADQRQWSYMVFDHNRL